MISSGRLVLRGELGKFQHHAHRDRVKGTLGNRRRTTPDVPPRISMSTPSGPRTPNRSSMTSLGRARVCLTPSV